MLILVSYDVSTVTPEGRKRLTALAKVCESRGKRVQKSLFECSIDAAQEREFQKSLLNIINEKEDSIRIYHLGNHGFDKVTCLGTAIVAFPDVLIY